MMLFLLFFVAVSAMQQNAVTEIQTIIVGNEKVGKSAILARLIGIEFPEEHEMTIGVPYDTTHWREQESAYQFKIWDTAGNERYRSIIKGHFKHAKVAIIVYDITDRESFSRVEYFKDIIIAGGADIDPDGVLVLIGNKNDLVEQRKVSEQEGEMKAVELGAIFMETSAKTGIDSDSLFNQIMNKLYPKSATETLSINYIAKCVLLILICACVCYVCCLYRSKWR
eukprot:432130_1